MRLPKLLAVRMTDKEVIAVSVGGCSAAGCRAACTELGVADPSDAAAVAVPAHSVLAAATLFMLTSARASFTATTNVASGEANNFSPGTSVDLGTNTRAPVF